MCPLMIFSISECPAEGQKVHFSHSDCCTEVKRKFRNFLDETNEFFSAEPSTMAHLKCAEEIKVF